MRNTNLVRPLVPSLVLVSLAACGGGGSSGGSSGGATGSLSGTVLGSPVPVSGCTVTATGTGGTFSTTTSALGFFQIDNVPVGSYEVELSGKDVFNSAGDPIADKVSLALDDVTIGEQSDTVLGGKPTFLPTLADGTMIDTSGTTSAVIAADTVIGNEDEGVFLVFEAATTE